MGTFRCSLLPLALALAAGPYTLSAAAPTWNGEVATIVQAKCQRCHRPNDIAPFSLLTYDDASSRAAMIGGVVAAGIMPPWKPVEGYGHFKDSYALTAEEKATILAWIDAGALRGEGEEPAAPERAAGEWVLGEPDRIVEMPEAYAVPADRADTYRCFVLDPALDGDRHVRAVQVLPGARDVVHHVLLFIDGTGQADELDAAEDGQGYTCFGGPGLTLGGSSLLAILGDRVGGLGGWVPGSRPQTLPEGVGIFLPKGAKIIMQVHYHPHRRDEGEQEPEAMMDQTKFGLYYTDTEVKKRLRYLPVVNTTFKLEPGKPAQEVTAELPIPPFLDAKALQIAPHMHTLGREIKVERIRGLPGNEAVEPMIYIDKWDFHWQGFYTYEEPVALKFGDRVKLTCTFDGHPERVVGWGEGTEDEMCLAFVGVIFDRFR